MGRRQHPVRQNETLQILRDLWPGTSNIETGFPLGATICLVGVRRGDNHNTAYDEHGVYESDGLLQLS